MKTGNQQDSEPQRSKTNVSSGDAARALQHILSARKRSDQIPSAKFAPTPPLITELPRSEQCCERDHNNDGNCDIHSAPGVLRSEQPQEWTRKQIAEKLMAYSKPELLAEVQILSAALAAAKTEALAECRAISNDQICDLQDQLAAERETTEQAERVAQVCYDLHDALGVKWGDDPYWAIRKLKDAALSAQVAKVKDE